MACFVTEDEITSQTVAFKFQLPLHGVVKLRANKKWRYVFSGSGNTSRD
jgi:hypothetical protein